MLICYSKGIKSIAEDLLVTEEKAQEIYDAVLDAFTGLKAYMISSLDYVMEHGYIENYFGIRRRLPDLFLPEYEVKIMDGFEWKYPEGLADDMVDSILNRVYKCRWYKDKQALYSELEPLGICIKDNNSFIAKAKRQIVNASVQSSSASITKKAMVLIDTNKRLRELDCRLVLSIHD